MRRLSFNSETMLALFMTKESSGEPRRGFTRAVSADLLGEGAVVRYDLVLVGAAYGDPADLDRGNQGETDADDYCRWRICWRRGNPPAPGCLGGRRFGSFDRACDNAIRG